MGCENSTVFDEDDVLEEGYEESIGDEWNEEERVEADLEEAEELQELQEGSLNGGEAVGEQSEVMTPVERTVVVDQGQEQNIEVLDEERIVHVKWEKARKRASLSPVAAAKEVVKTVSVSMTVPSPSSVKESPIDETEVAVPVMKVDSGVQWASESVGSEITNSWKVVHSWDKTKKPLKSILKKEEVREDASLEGLQVFEDTDLSDTVFAVWSEVPGEDLQLESDVVSAVEEQWIAEPEPETEEKPVERGLVGGEQSPRLSSVDSSMELYSEEGSASSDEEISRYARLFSDKELDDMDQCEPGQEGSALAGFEVAVEEEEYDKELEERLFPLDEVELGLKREANEEAQKEPSVADVARYLDWPVDMVERTREASPGEMSTPEYWLTWFGNTLESTEEAKRANRDFSSVKSESEVETVNFVTMEDVVEPTSESCDCLPMISVAWGPEVNEKEDLNLEETVRANIVVSISEDEDSVSTVTDVTRNDSLFGKATVRRATMKAVAREAVYRMLKEACVEAKKSLYEHYKDAESNAEQSIPPLRDKTPEIDWGRLHWHADCIVAERGILGEYWADLAEWACDYYAENALTVWRALCGRFDKAGNRLKKWRRWKKRKKLSFDCSVLFKNGAEALGEMTVREGDEDDPSNYVELTREDPTGVRTAPSSGMRESAEGEEETEETTIVGDGSRVVCAVGNYEALSSGYIDCLPSRMLADTGATLSLVDRTVMRRLGRGAEPLEPYAGRVNSSSGHPLRVRGWATVPVRLGSVLIDLRVLVVDKLHVDAILGVDALGAFGAVIDVEERTMTLKRTGETLELGVAVVELRFSAALASAIRLPPKSQALVMATVVGRIADGFAVLVEGSLKLPPMLRAARSLCTVERGQVIVELCNLSTEEQWLRKGTVVASLSLIPDSAFAEEGVPRSAQSCQTKEGTAEDEEQSAEDEEQSIEDEPRVEPHIDEVGEPKPVIPPDKPLGVKADFGDSCLTEEQKSLFQAELDSFSDLFVESSKKPGRTDLLEFEIDTGDSPPIKQRPYRVSGAEGDVMEAEIQQYLEIGFIRPSNSPWASPVLMIRKPDGGIRFCIDYRKLNAVTVKDCYPMPLIDDILDVLGDAQLFSTMDIASGYWNVPMHPGSVGKTAFTCKYGLYEWLVMPFGLCNAVPAFERLMETVLVDLKWRICLVYLDDCVVFSKDFPTHLVRVRQVLTRFRSAGFKLKMKKCHWGKNQVAFLGHIVTPSGILPNPEKVKAVMNVQRPQDLHGIRSFLGLTSYFRRYIPGYALISAPLEQLKTKDTPFVWTDDCESAFKQLKRALVKPPILVYPDHRKRFLLFVDSSRYAVGACLMQKVKGRNRVVAYASKLLTGSQKNWIKKEDGISEIECWGVVWATRKFRCYLDKREFDLFTDHQALTWVFNPGNRTRNAKLARWAMELSNLQFKVHHRPGISMGHVDGLSRLPADRADAISIADLLNPSSEGPEAEPLTPVEQRETAEIEEEQMLDLGGDSRTEEAQEDPPPVGPRDRVDEYSLDSEQFLAEQQMIPWIRAMVAFLLDGALPLDRYLRARVVKMAPRFTVEQGILKRRVNLPARVGPARTVTVPVVPPSYAETVLHYCHKDILAAHLGVTKTRERVRAHAYWPGWRQDVTEYVRECELCGAGKGHRPWKAGLMQRMPVVELTGPFSLVVVDAVGPLIETDRGNKYILVFVDYFTRWAEAYAVRSLDTVTFVEAMVDGVVSRHGVPNKLLSDRGTNFTSELAKSFYETLGIKKLFGAAYHPQTQGLVERFNGTLIGMLKMYVSEAQTDWDVYLPRVLFAYRTAYHEALGDSPFFSLYGRDPVLPLDVAFLNLGEKWKSNEVAQYRRELHRSLRDSRHLVERQLIKAQDRHADRLQEQTAVQYEVGDQVWVYQFFRAKRGERRTKKLAFSWHGPYRVYGKVRENTYRIEIPSHPDRNVSVNVNRLKRFRGRWTRPFMDEIPMGLEETAQMEEEGPLAEEDLPRSSFAERLTVSKDDTVIAGVDAPLLEVIAKRRVAREVEYLVLTANFETFWLRRTELIPAYSSLVDMFEQSERVREQLPTLRRSERLADANVEVDENDLLMV